VAGAGRIIVGVHGSLGSLQALRYAADLARERGVPLIAVLCWVPPGGDLAERSHPSPFLREIWQNAAWERLHGAFDEGLGGVPADIRVQQRVGRGEPGLVLADFVSQPGDLLVIGTGRRTFTGRLLRKSVGHYLLAHARCPVVAVPPSALMEEVEHGFWPRRRRHTVSDISEMTGK
jgi:nucleotide-binding universal stress UspA family protein